MCPRKRGAQKTCSVNSVVSFNKWSAHIRCLTRIGTKDWSLSRSLTSLPLIFLPCLKMGCRALLMRPWYALSFIQISVVWVSISDGFPICRTSAFLTRQRGQRHSQRCLIHDKSTLRCMVSTRIHKEIIYDTYFSG
jgi:hypothetical protein